MVRGARRAQSLRHRRQRLSDRARGQPDAHHDGKCLAGVRVHCRAPRQGAQGAPRPSEGNEKGRHGECRMTSQADWPTAPRAIDAEPDGPMFFTNHEWATVEAATARIYPTDGTPGAREAHVVRFIDRYLSGLDYVFASADGSGFLAVG